MISGYLYVCFFLIFAGIVAVNGILLFQLSMKGESKKEFIKIKSLAETMQITIAILVIDSVNFTFDISKYGDGYESMNPIYILFALSVFFLVSLLRNTRIYGGKNKKSVYGRKNRKRNR